MKTRFLIMILALSLLGLAGVSASPNKADSIWITVLCTDSGDSDKAGADAAIEIGRCEGCNDVSGSLADVENPCSCEGTYAAWAESICDGGPENTAVEGHGDALYSKAGGEDLYAVNYDDPPPNGPMPNYCTKTCLGKLPHYWDPNADNGDGECCGDDSSDDPDQYKGFCKSCPIGKSVNNTQLRAWDDNAKCCGDDEEDCGLVSAGYLCAITNESKSTWFTATLKDEIGNIRYVPCNNREYLSDGKTWMRCDNKSWEKTVTKSGASHNVFCNGIVGPSSLTECCGDDKCFSMLNENQRKTGGSVDDINKTRYYCTLYNDWTTNLDEIYAKGDTAGKSCNEAQKPSTSKNKTYEGFNFTTTLCCGDDNFESWNDPAPNGKACWQGGTVPSCSKLVNGNRTMNENGILYGCKINDINEADYCTTRCSNNFFCSYTSQWKDSLSLKRDANSSWPGVLPSGGIPTECCQKTECWNGLQCIADQEADPRAGPQPGTDYRCINGSWMSSVQKSTPDQSSFGYCPSNEQCLSNLAGNFSQNNNPNANPQCINKSQYAKDNYCEQGNWTTRTKLTALQLLDIADIAGAQTDYTLFCDNYINVLNYVGYATSANLLVKNYLEKTNKFCVLKYGNTVIFGTSLNQPIDYKESPFLDVLGIAECSIKNDNKFNPCDGAGKIWHNNQSKIVIYSSTAITLRETDLMQLFINFLKNPLKPVMGWAEDIARYDYKFIKNTRKFDKLYIRRSSDKSIQAILEGGEGPTEKIYIAIDYTNVPVDICFLVDSYDAAHGNQDYIICENKGNNNYYVATKDFGFDFNPLNIWSDLTAKLRIE